LEISGVTSWQQEGKVSPVLLRYDGDMSALCFVDDTKGSLTLIFTTSHSQE